MDQLQNTLLKTANQVEKQIDSQLDHLENLDLDDLQKIRNQRIKEMKNLSKKRQEWLANGHGIYEELPNEKEFLEISKISPNIVCHFYKNSNQRCEIVDMHLKLLATKHIEARFVKVNAEKSPFLTQRLKIKIIPTIVLVKDSITEDYIVGFTDLGNCDDYSTEMMEWRIAQSGTIDYNGDLMTPPDITKKSKTYINRPKKTIRGGCDSDDSDIELGND